MNEITQGSCLCFSVTNSLAAFSSLMFLVKNMIHVFFYYAEDWRKGKTHIGCRLLSYSVSNVLSIFPSCKSQTNKQKTKKPTKEYWAYMSTKTGINQGWWRILPSLLGLCLLSPISADSKPFSSWIYSTFGVRPSTQFFLTVKGSWTIR